jgi:peptide/nickel transport system substrate-binding protein
MRRFMLAAALAAAIPAAIPAGAQTLRIGLAEDPDILDPTLARTFVGRIVFAGLCDKLFDIDKDLRIVPQLATGYRWDGPLALVISLREGVVFHDGEPMTAEAVAYSLNRHLTMQGSFRRSEISSMERVEVVDPRTVRLVLREPFSPFVSQLTDRAGMIVSPRAAEAAGAQFGTAPVCAGPMRFVQRVAQDRIVLERFDRYWDAANIHIRRVEYRPIPDSTARLANLQAGALELIERVNPNDIPDVRRNRNLRLTAVDELGYQTITFNLNNGPRAQSPIGRDPRVREAFDLAIDRAALNQVVYQGEFSPSIQFVPPAHPMHVQGLNPLPRNVERARALLREAGHTAPVVVNLIAPNSPDLRQVAEVVQAMTREAGFDVRIQAMEFASSLQAAQRGEFEAYLLAWSGRVDADGNVFTFRHSTGAQNDGRYSNPQVDDLLVRARRATDDADRRALYEQAIRIMSLQDRPVLYLWHRKQLVAHTARLSGFEPVADGMIRLQGLRLGQ